MEQTRIDEFRNRRFGLFLHWGLYSVLGGRYKDRTMEYIGEWIQSRFHIPNQEYATLANQFNPELFNADEWISEAKAAGVDYIVITAKHHEGFSMFRTEASDFNICDATPFKRDPLLELSQACARHGVGFGVYYSQYLDWHEKDAGDTWPNETENVCNMSWSNIWDFPDRENKDFGKYFEAKVVPQLTELLTNYGPVCELWCDCPLNIKPEYSQRIRDLVHELQPDCMINSRIGNNCGDFKSLGDNMIMSSRTSIPCECPLTMNGTWGFKYDDHNWKSPETIAWSLASLASRNANCLVNIGPQPDGLLPEPSIKVLRALAEWKKTLPENAVSYSAPSPFTQNLSWGCCTRTGNRLNLFVKDWKESLELNGIQSRIVKASVPFKQDGEKLVLETGARPESILPVITLECEDEPVIDSRLLPQDGVLELTPPLGSLVHGRDEDNSDGAERVAVHSAMETGGEVVDWHNPADSIEWELYFPDAGIYDVEVTTSHREYSGPHSWTGRRRVKVEWNDGTRIEKILTADRIVSEGILEKRASLMGTIRVKAGESGKFTLRTVEILDTIALPISLVNVILTRREDPVLYPLPEVFGDGARVFESEAGFQGNDHECRFERAHRYILPCLEGGVDNLFLGDSITAVWPVEEYFPGKSIINRGIPGDALSGMYRRLQRDVLDWKPKRVFIMGGINGIGLPNEYTLGALTAIAETLQKKGIDVVLQSILPLREPDRWGLFQYMDSIRWVNARLKEWAAANGAVYIDHFSTLIDESGQLAAGFAWEDGIHLHPTAYQCLSHNVSEYLL